MLQIAGLGAADRGTGCSGPPGAAARASARPWPMTRGPVIAQAPDHHEARPATGHGRAIPVRARSISMRFTGFSSGSIRVDGVTYDHDLVIDRGKIRKRKKAASRKFRGAYGHTPLCRGGHPVAVPPAGDRHRRRCRAAGHAAGPGRGPPPQGRPRRPHGAGDRRHGQGRTRHQRHLAPDLLNARGQYRQVTPPDAFSSAPSTQRQSLPHS
jgi:hypothetical protein